MNTIEIDRILFSDKYCGPIFHGTYAIDELPSFQHGCFVVNLAPSSHPGTHWVTIYKDIIGHVEYFDSGAKDPPGQLIEWWGRRKKFVKNPYVLQNAYTAVCGQYCIYYLTLRCRGIGMKHVLQSFDQDKVHNDLMVYRFVQRKLRSQSSVTVIYEDRPLSQSAVGGCARWIWNSYFLSQHCMSVQSFRVWYPNIVMGA